jgi:hypothetical protein
MTERLGERGLGKMRDSFGVFVARAADREVSVERRSLIRYAGERFRDAVAASPVRSA